MVFEELDVRVSANTDSFERGIDSAERSLSSFNPQALETAAALQVLQGRADEAGDELFDIAPRATTAAVGLEGVSLGATSASISFSGLATVTAVSLLPAIVALSTALVPVVAAFGGFIAVAGAIAGLGFAGAIGAISTNTQQLKSSALDTLETFRDVFAPVINAATVTISNLLNQLERVAPQLALTNEEARTIGNLFTELGSAIIDLLPALVDLGVSLTQQFLPPFIDFVERVGPRIPGIIQNLVRVFQRLVPTLRGIGRFISRFGPEFLQFGFVVLNVLTPAIAGFGNAVGRTLRFVTGLDQSLQGLIAGITLVAPVVLGLAKLLGGPITAAIVGVTAAVIGLSRVFSSNFAGIRDDVSRLSTAVQSILPNLQSAFNSFLEGANISAITDEVSGLVTEIDEQLTSSIEALDPVFSDINELLETNQEEFSAIGGAVGFLARAGINLATALVSVLGPAFRKIIIPVFRGFIDIIDFGLTKLSQFIKLAGAIKSGDIEGAVSEANQLFGGGENPELNIDTPSAETSRELSQQIEIVLEENTEIVDARIEDGANRALQSQSDQAQRNAGSRGFRR